MNRLSMFAIAATTMSLAAAAPAPAADDAPPDTPGPPTCDGGPLFGPERPHGSTVFRPPGAPLPGTLGQPAGIYVCIGGIWVLIDPLEGPGGGPIFMEGAPSLSADNAGVSAVEGGTATNTGIVTYPGDAAVALGATPGAVTRTSQATWAWTLPTTDGPAQSQNVLVTGTADDKVGGTSFGLTVQNVAPVVQSVTPDSSTVLAGQPVTFRGVATDASPEDTLAGFSWAFDGTPVQGDASTTTFGSCGAATVSATATDKDGGTSDAVTSAAVRVVEGRVAAPLRMDAYNLVRAGQVVPVRVEIGCGDVAADGLSPAIQLLNGDVDPATDTGDPALLVPTTDATGTDTGNVMRAAGGAYIYNLRVPNGPVGSRFTVRVRPVDGGGSALYAVLQIRR